MSLKLHLLRHGETEFSQSGGYCGVLDPDLTAAGHQMAQAFADTYATKAWSAVYSSPLRRTLATAKPLCDRLGLEPQVRPGLAELHYGDWEGKTHTTVNQEYHEDYVRWLTEPAWNPPTGGETATELSNRAMPVIAEIQDICPDGNVLVVSHKATIRVILCTLLGIDLGRYRDRIAALAASVSIVEFDVHGPLLETLGDRYHLPPELREREGT
ncbi:MAG: histidine phosphatase family protein [Spirulinaceae cyanobacterium SM2_1_0]|nr:histidine phosphatase family protein [Spirulinaceae cyanobacterium SM2_1_0]